MKKADKLSNLTLPVTAIVVSFILGGFFYVSQLSKQQSIERQQKTEIIESKKEQIEKEAKEIRNKENLEKCLSAAETQYSNNWYRECKSRGELTSRCISLHDTSFEEYRIQNNIPEYKENNKKWEEELDKFLNELDECSCRLPAAIADSIGDDRDSEKNDCFKKYPQQ